VLGEDFPEGLVDPGPIPHRLAWEGGEEGEEGPPERRCDSERGGALPPFLRPPPGGAFPVPSWSVGTTAPPTAHTAAITNSMSNPGVGTAAASPAAAAGVFVASGHPRGRW